MSRKPYIDKFIKLIYPEMTELAMAILSEEECIKDATKLIKELEKGQLNFAKEMEKILKVKIQRIKKLEDGYMKISVLNAGRDKDIAWICEHALKGGD